MPLIDHTEFAELGADYLKIALLKRGEVISLARPPGEGYMSARSRFEGYGVRLGFTLRLWWALKGQRWFVVRMK